MKIIDTHSHIVYGVDDGAQSIEDSLELLKLAYENGICEFIATPHRSLQYPNNDSQLLLERCKALEIAAKEKISQKISVYPGAEIMYRDGVFDMVEKGEILKMANSDCVLLEFIPYTTPYNVMLHAVHSARRAGLKPILAHIERYHELDSVSKVQRLIDEGCMTQLNYEFIGGGLFDKYARKCHKFLKAGCVHFLGTDMHNMTKRPPMTERALNWMRKNLKEEYINEICYNNAYWLLIHPVK